MISSFFPTSFNNFINIFFFDWFSVLRNDTFMAFLIHGSKMCFCIVMTVKTFYSNFTIFCFCSFHIIFFFHLCFFHLWLSIDFFSLFFKFYLIFFFFFIFFENASNTTYFVLRKFCHRITWIFWRRRSRCLLFLFFRCSISITITVSIGFGFLFFFLFIIRIFTFRIMMNMYVTLLFHL